MDRSRSTDSTAGKLILALGSPWALAALVAGAFALLLHASRGLTFSIDELTWVIDTPDFSARDVLEPYNGHLIATTRIAYAGLLNVLGSDYVIYRVLGIASVATTVVLLWLYLRPLVPPALALAPAPLLLLFGSDAVHVVNGNAFTVLGSISCGLAALILLRRRDLAGDLLASVLLCLAVLTYSVGLAFVLGVWALVLLDAERWRRIWVPLAPTLLYAGWWLWSLSLEGDSGEQLSAANLPVIPAWAFQLLQATLDSMSGLDYDFTGSEASDSEVGAILAVLALGALAWRLARRPASPGLWMAITVFAGLALMTGLAPGIDRTPETPRYMFPAAIAVILIAAHAAAGARWRRGWVLAIWALALVGALGNGKALFDHTNAVRDNHDAAIRADLTAIELAGENADPEFQPQAAGAGFGVTFAWGGEIFSHPPTEAYLVAAEKYGRIGYSPQEVLTLDEATRERIDRMHVAALGLGLGPADRLARSCEHGFGGERVVEVPAGEALLLSGNGGEGALRVGRFSDSPAVPLGATESATSFSLELPADDVGVPWKVALPRGYGICEA